MKLVFTPLIALAGVCALSGCKNAADEAEPAPTATVEVQPATEHSIEDALIAYGTVEFVQAHTRALTVQVESQVAERFVLPGTLVKAGQPLIRLVPSAMSRLDVDKATRDASVAEAEAQRVGRLHAQGLATDSDLRTAKAASDSAIQLRDSLNSRIGASGLTLRAPIAGSVDTFTAQPGDVIAPGTLLMRIADPKALFARIGLEPEDAVRVRSGQAVTLAALTTRAQIAAGKVTEVDARVDPQTRLAAVVVQPESTTNLVPGSAVRARIVLGTHEKALTVPRAAVLYTNEQPYLFISDEKKAHRRPVKVGLTDDTQVEILSGLKQGELVVVGGNYELEDGMAVQLPGADKAEAEDKDDAKGDAKGDAKDDAKDDTKDDAGASAKGQPAKDDAEPPPAKAKPANGKGADPS
jgi:RND family efflux transporter MFP subunit